MYDVELIVQLVIRSVIISISLHSRLQFALLVSEK